jgi:hypothetical protein
MFESNEAVARVWPEGAQATALTVFAWPVGILESGVNLYFFFPSESEEDGEVESGRDV